MHDVLQEILTHKRAEVAEASARTPLHAVREAAEHVPAPRDFYAAVAAPRSDWPHLIAEIKRSSPSAGLIRADFDPTQIARAYAEGGATALSVLTDARYFDGRLAFIAQVKQAVQLPVLRKDFVIDAYQVYEARAAGADAVLLIGEALAPAQLADLAHCALDLQLSVLIEVHSAGVLEGVLQRIDFSGPQRLLLGVNNRDLKAQRTDLAITERLLPLAPPGAVLVSESGISTTDDVRRVMRAGAHAMLVGESLMRAADIADAARRILSAS